MQTCKILWAWDMMFRILLPLLTYMLPASFLSWFSEETLLVFVYRSIQQRLGHHFLQTTQSLTRMMLEMNVRLQNVFPYMKTRWKPL